MSKPIYDIEVETLDGETKTLKEYEGKVLLVVNTASKCGFTPQYEGLESLHKQLGDKGLAILAFPCNQFGKQEPGDADAIGAFCQKNYGVSFPVHAKIEVNGDSAHPLFKLLKREQRGILGTEAVKWNFTKFLVDKHGNVVARHAPKTEPATLVSEIEQLLAER